LAKIDRYILRFHLGPFLFGTATVVFLFLMQFVLTKLDQLVGKGIDTFLILKLIALNVPWMMILAMPMGMLFGSLMAFGNMSSAHEITIIKASKTSLIRMMYPLLILGILLSGFVFWFNDVVLPESNHQSKILLNDIRKTKPTFALESGRFSQDIAGYKILARKLDSASGLMRGVTIYNSERLNQQNVVSADSGTISFTPDMSKLYIVLKDGEVHQNRFNRHKGYKIIEFEQYEIYLDASSFGFNQTDGELISRGQREMNITDMRQIQSESKERVDEKNIKINKLIDNHFDKIFAENNDKRRSRKSERLSKREPSTYEYLDTLEKYTAIEHAEKSISFLLSNLKSDIHQEKRHRLKIDQYEVEIQKKYSIPIACFLFVLVGCPLGIMTKRGNFGVSAAISLGFYILYWSFLIGGEKFADRGYLDPILSMWLGNIIIALMGIFLTLKVNFESLSLRMFK